MGQTGRTPATSPRSHCPHDSAARDSLAQAVQHIKGSSEEERSDRTICRPFRDGSSLIGWDSTWGGLWKSMGKFGEVWIVHPTTQKSRFLAPETRRSE